MVTLASKLCYNYVVVTLYLSKNSRFIIHSRRFFEAVTVISGRRVSKFLRFYVIDNIQSIQRLVDFTQNKIVVHILGNHIENSRTPYLDYKVGTVYQPDEHALELGRG